MHNLGSVVQKSKKRVGRGVVSGKGFHTTGRGQKGQKARYTVPVLFEGVKTKKSLLHRLPVLPGKLKNAARPKPNTITIEQLNTLPAGDVTMKVLFEHGLIARKYKNNGAKVLGSGTVTNVYNLSVSASESARTAIEKAGGTIA